MRITNNILVLSGGYFSAVNDFATLGEVYGVVTPRGVIVIDCGNPVTGPAMMRETLAYFEINEPITHVIVTHAHYDHCGGAKELQDFGAKIIVGQGDAAYCENGGPRGLFETPFDIEQAYPAFVPDITVADDNNLEINGLEFEFILIPGHTPGSMAIRVSLDNKTAVFTGDALQVEGMSLDSVSFGWRGDPNYCEKSVVKSMLKLMKIETDMVLPGHGKVCVRNGSRLLRHAAQQAFLTMR